jgi:Chalcone isomerase-like
MKTAKRISLLFWLAAAVLPAAGAATMEGLRFDDSARVANRELRLNGLGLRAVYIFKAFVAGLYLSDRASTGQEVLLNQSPKRLQLRMLMEVGANDIKKALIDGMRKNVSEAQWSAMEERALSFAQTIDSIGVTRPGDTINLDYQPERGMTLAVNDVSKGTAINGEDFYTALLKIFVGDDPVDTRMRKGLLGQ